MAENPTESTPRKSVASKAGVCSVCRCCNDNIFERKHPIDLYGAKATKESILGLLERLVGYKCHIEDGMPSKACRPCYDKIMKFKKFKEIFENSTAQQRSMIRFKRGKSKGDSPSLISSGHVRKKLAESDNTSASSESLSRGSLFPSTARPILPAPSISVSEPVKEAVISSKRRELPRGLFPQPPPKPTSKSVEILFQSGLHNPAVGQNPRKFWMYVVIQIISAFSFGGNVHFIHLCSNSMSFFFTHEKPGEATKNKYFWCPWYNHHVVCNKNHDFPSFLTYLSPFCLLFQRTRDSASDWDHVEFSLFEDMLCC